MLPSPLDAINAKLDGLLYLSESEEPLELLQWPGVCTMETVQNKIAGINGGEPSAQTLQSLTDFLAPILKMAVPEDPAMQEYAQRWTELLKVFQEQTCEVQVILSPVKEAIQQIYIVGFREEGAWVLHTSAVVT